MREVPVIEVDMLIAFVNSSPTNSTMWQTLKMAGKWVTPLEYYTREKTKMIVDEAKFVVDVIKTHPKRTF